MAKFFVISHENEVEIKIKNSRFIASGKEIQSTKQAQKFLKTIKEKYPDANHHCYAYKIGQPTCAEYRFSDDGEPTGTAGKPIFQVIDSQLTNTIIVVTRYFGGIKLGKGGLVKAYTEAAQTLIKDSQLKEFFIEKELQFTYPYHLTSQVEHLLKQYEIERMTRSFSEKVDQTIWIRDSLELKLIQELEVLAGGKVLFKS